MPAVTIVMRTYERPVLLARALASVQAQTFGDWHLVVVNNGGDPKVVDAVVGAAREGTSHGAIETLHLPDRVGMEEASNIALSRSSSEFFAVHDDDDSWVPTYLEVTTSLLGASSCAAVVTGVTRVHETFRDGKVWPISEEAVPLSEGRLSFAGMIGGNTFPPIAALFRRSVFETVGGFDASLPVLGDWEFNLRAVRHGGFLFHAERLARYHTRTIDSDASSGNTITMGRDLHHSVRALLQDRWLREPAENGVNKGALSISALAVNMVDERLAAGFDADAIATKTAEIIEMRKPLRRVLRAVANPSHGLRAVSRVLRRRGK